MNSKTVQNLLDLNKKFYEKVAENFNLTRHYQWGGWTELLDIFSKLKFEPKTVLDLGCGNGRFAEALQGLPCKDYTYLGIDTNTFLLSRAMEKYTTSGIRFLCADIVPSLAGKSADLIVLFGVFHHAPSYAKRLDFLKKLRRSLNTGGRIVITVWNFTELKLFAKRLNPAQILNIGFDVNELEQNDFILRWSNTQSAFRYCHFCTNAEMQSLVDEAGLKIETMYDSDGGNGKTNTYYIIKQKA